MNNTLVTFFSASGKTKQLAKTIAEETGADIFEIEPKEKYTGADLDYMNKSSRSSIEMNDKSFRPEMKEDIDVSDYDTIFIGFPIWWYECPRIIQTFLEAHDFSGKTVIPFATSGSSGIGGSEEVLKQSSSPQTNWKPGKRFSASESPRKIRKWIDELNI